MSNVSFQYQDPFIVRESTILTNSFVIGKIIDHVQFQTQLILYVDFTLGSLTDAEIKIEFSDDESDWYQNTVSAVSSGIITHTLDTHKLITTGKYRIQTPIKDKFIRISAKGNGIVTGSLMKILGIVGSN